MEVAHSAALGILGGPDAARDPRWVPAPLQGPAVDGPIRVAVVRAPLGGGIDTHVRAGIDHTADWLADAMRMVLPVNLLGLPSFAVPVGCDDGLPQGVQLIGARLREDLPFDAAQAIEHRAPSLTPMHPHITVGV